MAAAQSVAAEFFGLGVLCQPAAYAVIQWVVYFAVRGAGFGTDAAVDARVGSGQPCLCAGFVQTAAGDADVVALRQALSYQAV